MKFTIDGTGIPDEKTPADLAREFMLGEVMASALKQLRALDKPWLRLPEAQQRQVIDEVREDVQAAIRKAVEIIATDDRTCFTAAVESVTFKDGVKAVLTMPNTPASHELADTQGGRIWLVLDDPARYTQQTAGMPQAEPDQAGLAV
jgi:hypothetical protein